MKKLALAAVAALTLGLAAPAIATDASAATTNSVAVSSATVKKIVKVGPRRTVTKVVVKRPRAHRSWRHRHGKTVIIKKRGNGTVVKKVVHH